MLAQSSVQSTVTRLIEQVRPRLVGLSVMTFQRGTARRIISLVRSLKPDVLIAVGGYDPSLAPEAWTDPALGVDFIVRGEGDVTFRELLRAIEGSGDFVVDPRAVVPKRREGSSEIRRGPPPRWTTVTCDRRLARPRAVRLHDDGTSDRRCRDLARVHLRLQLLFDHRDARAQLPPLRHRSRDRRHRRCSRPRRPVHLPRGRQHHNRCPTAREVVSRNRRSTASTMCCTSCRR